MTIPPSNPNLIHQSFVGLTSSPRRNTSWSFIQPPCPLNLKYAGESLVFVLVIEMIDLPHSVFSQSVVHWSTSQTKSFGTLPFRFLVAHSVMYIGASAATRQGLHLSLWYNILLSYIYTLFISHRLLWRLWDTLHPKILNKSRGNTRSVLSSTC